MAHLLMQRALNHELRDTRTELRVTNQSTKDFVRNFNLFMQNEPKFQKPKITINYCPQRTYKDFAFSKLLENEPKRTQNEPKLKNPKINLFHYLKRTYNIFRDFALSKNKPKQTQNKPNSTIAEKTISRLKNPPTNTNHPHSSPRRTYELDFIHTNPYTTKPRLAVPATMPTAFARSSKMRFTKMHGLGNDYVYVNCFEEKIADPAKLAQIVSNRHFGIGSDGLILICPSETADVRMRIFNADGSEAEMCGNGIRCVAKYVYEHKLAKAGGPFAVPGQPPCPSSLNIETGNGVLKVGLEIDNDDKIQKACVNMGQPILKPADIPVKLAGEKVIEEPIEISGQKLQMTCVSMGNPHAVFFCDDVEQIELEKIGPAVENHQFSPHHTNVQFVHVISPAEFKMRTWERGSGITMACGSGACACAVAAVLLDRAERVCTAHLPGGDLELNWCQQDNCVYMTGPATEAFEGDWPQK